MTIELKPCPFCGSEAADPDGNNHTWCSETSCGSDAYLSVEAWNRRPEPGKPESGVLAGKVKPLEWDAPDSWRWNLAKTVLGTYVVRPCLATNFAGQFLMCRPGDDDSVLFPSEDAAKAAAQSDYEQRIMSALTTPPQPEALQRRVEELEAALEFYADELTWADTNPKDDDRITVLVPSPSFAEIDRGKVAREVLVPWREGAKP